MGVESSPPVLAQVAPAASSSAGANSSVPPSLSKPSPSSSFPPPSRPTTPPVDSTRSSMTVPTPLYASAEGDKAGKRSAELGSEGGKVDFGFLPIPRRLQWDPEHPPHFGLLLNAIFAFAATFSVANLYYPQPILIALSEEFNCSYSDVVNVPTLLQASYALGLLFICPCGDLVRRRPMLLLLVFVASILTLISALVPSIRSFQAISFFLGACSVTPQVLLPLAGDLAHPNKRASALAIVLAGLLLGILLARVLAGAIAEAGSVADVYYMSTGLNVAIWQMLYWTVPDYPAKNPNLSYFRILVTMAKYAVTEPVLVQSCIIGCCSSALFSCFWTTSTFLLGDHYGYNTAQIGLFGLVGVAGVAAAPFIGKLVDGLVPWSGVLLGIGILTISQAIYTGAGGISIGAIIVVILFLDIGQQLQQVSNSTRIFAISTEARARLSAVYIFAIFVGQLIGTAAGTRIYLDYGGFRASGAFCLALLALMLIVLCLRGPHLPTKRWFGAEGGWELRRWVIERQKEERLDQRDVELEKKHEV